MEYLIYFGIALLTFLFFTLLEKANNKWCFKNLFAYFSNSFKDKWYNENDSFFVFNALMSVVIIMFGIFQFNYYLISIGVGLLIYSINYFVFHDPYMKDQI